MTLHGDGTSIWRELAGTAAVLLVTWGCTSADAATPRPPDTDSRPPRHHNGAVAKTWKLKKKLADMGNKEFSEWVKSKDGPPWQDEPVSADRKCKASDDKDCDNAQKPKRTKVYLDVVVEASFLDLDKIPENGVVVAKLDVDGEFWGDAPTEYVYGLKEGYHYYVVVEPYPGKVDEKRRAVGKWSLVQVDKKGVHTVPLSGTFKRCDDQAQPDWSYGAFTGCPTRHEDFHRLLREESRTARGPIRLEALRGMLGSPVDSPIWISCIHGCCIAETDQRNASASPVIETFRRRNSD